MDVLDKFDLVLDKPARSVHDAAANVCTAEKHTGMVGAMLAKAIERLREALYDHAQVARARNTDPDTSHDAAAEATLSMTPNREAVLKVFVRAGKEGLTDFQLARHYEGPMQSASGLRTRRSELVRMGYLMNTGSKRANDAGRASIVWSIQPATKS